MYMWTAVMGWKPEEVQVFIAHIRRQMRDPDVHSNWRLRCVYARKPGPVDKAKDDTEG